MGRSESRSQHRKTRCDGWTVERQLAFLTALSRTRSVIKAARAVGMSRESAYRLRGRAELFAALWDRAFAPARYEGHNPINSDGRLMRLLGNDHRRQTNGFWPKASAASGAA